MSDFLEFLKAALKNPRQISTVFQTGTRVAERFARRLRLQENELLVELGVGAGAITSHLLPALKSPQNYVGFELSPDLYHHLRKKFPELEIHNRSADELADFVQGRPVGAVVSTLPWSLLGENTRESIIRQIQEALVPGGVFATFLALHVLKTPGGQHLQKLLEEHFSEVTFEVEWRNIPPCRVYFALKK